LTRPAPRQGSVLDGHKLVLRLSLRRGAAAEPTEPKAAEKPAGRGTKLVVRNLAFEATRKDVVALFGPFGQVKSCRLPKKFDGSHRCARPCRPCVPQPTCGRLRLRWRGGTRK